MAVADTNWPMTELVPADVSMNSMEETMWLSSSTVPHTVHTVSPDDSFVSSSDEPHVGHDDAPPPPPPPPPPAPAPAPAPAP